MYTSLQSYEEQFSSTGVSCSNGILNFSNFGFDSSGATALTDSQIDLSPTQTVDLGQTGATGFSVTGLDGSPISVGQDEDVTYVLDWLYIIDSGPITGGASIGMDPPTGDIAITQYYCPDSNFNTSISQVLGGATPTCSISLEGTIPAVQKLSVSTTNAANCDLDGAPANDDYCASIPFNPVVQDYANVMTVIQLTGGDNPEGASFGSINGTAEILPGAPEPGTLLLLPGALLVLAFIRKRLTQ